MSTPEKCADSALALIAGYSEHKAELPVSIEEIKRDCDINSDIYDALADICHLCRREGIDFNSAAMMATVHARDESIENTPEYRERGGLSAEQFVEAVAESARDQFWAQVAADFPEVDSGDLSPDLQFGFEEITKRVITAWLEANARGRT